MTVARGGWWVYLLRCRGGALYTGVTTDLARRLAAHRAGKGGAFTRSHLPVQLVYVETRRSRGDALRREHQIKDLPRVAKARLAGAPA